MLRLRGGMAVSGFRTINRVMDHLPGAGSQRTVLTKCQVGLSAQGKKGIRNQPSMCLEAVGDRAHLLSELTVKITRPEKGA